MNRNPTPATAVPPGRILTRELEARGWTESDLAAIMERPPQAISEIVQGKKRVTPETAHELAQAFGTSPEFWMNLEANYRLYLAQKKVIQKPIARKSHLYALAPIRELMRRGWIKAVNQIEVLEQEMRRFLGVSSVDETPRLAVSLRVSKERGPEINGQVAWLKRAEHLARAQKASAFSLDRLRDALPKLLECAKDVDQISRVPSTLLALGVHFLVVPTLPKTFVDGAMFYLENRPVVALSLRYDRIDAFWFTLMHELAHILAGHKGTHVDNDIYSAAVSEGESKADEQALQWLVNRHALASFVRHTKPYFSRTAIERFAFDQGRHPGIVLGQLQHDGTVKYSNLRDLLVKVRPYLEDWIDVPAPQAVHST